MKNKNKNKSKNQFLNNYQHYFESNRYKQKNRDKVNNYLDSIINTLLYLNIKKLIFIIFLIIILSSFINIISNKDNNINIISNKDNNYKPKTKAIYSTNSTLNKGFLEIKTIHKGKFTYYDYISNIKVYKDLYEDKSSIQITEKNYILSQELISKEEYCKICEKGTLLDKNKYKRNKNPKISVVIPYYNRGGFSITMTLRSIQNQSLKDIEIIIVDDGSSEEAIKDIFEAMKDENRIIFLRHKERKTTLLTRVDGIRFASGEYIIQVDQDDMYLTNLLFETLYKKAKELNVDLIHFNNWSNDNPSFLKSERPPMPSGVIISQPQLRTAFFAGGGNSLYYCKIRMIWDLFVRRTTFLEAIEDLGDEYMNHPFRLYEDTLMMFELSQVAYTYFFMDNEMGYRHCTFNSGKNKAKDEKEEKEILAMNQLLFMKLLLHKIDPKYDRYHIYRELGFGRCENDVKHLNRRDFDLGLEVVEDVFELERIYKNTSPQLINCINTIKKYYMV